MDKKEYVPWDKEKIASNDEEIFYEELWEAGIFVLTSSFEKTKIR
ncbi:MAG: hypothetical protein ACXAAM_00980 [Candidatus Heimdallarchaeaceae archaeon]|jgi:hypothetical protein